MEPQTNFSRGFLGVRLDNIVLSGTEKVVMQQIFRASRLKMKR